jgi:hypothetical protein
MKKTCSYMVQIHVEQPIFRARAMERGWTAQASAALSALAWRPSFGRKASRKLSLPAAVVEFCESAKKRNGHTLREAVEGLLSFVLTVKRISLRKAIEQFIAFRKSKTVGVECRRPRWSSGHGRNTGYGLRESEETLPGPAVSPGQPAIAIALRGGGNPCWFVIGTALRVVQLARQINSDKRS